MGKVCVVRDQDMGQVLSRGWGVLLSFEPRMADLISSSYLHD